MKEKIAFIICANDEIYLKECIFYINKLNVPQKIEIDIIVIREAKSITSAYNAAIRESKAKYKVYLHQDVFIIYKEFIYDIIDIFKNKTIGMIGVMGGKKYLKNANFSYSWDTGMTLACNSQKSFLLDLGNNTIKKYEEVITIDGMLMITQYDIRWQEEDIDGWHFYDISQSLEFRKKGYKIVIPYQEQPWALHDAGCCSARDYDKYRKVFCEKYRDFGFQFHTKDNNTYTTIQFELENIKKKIMQCIIESNINKMIILLNSALGLYFHDTFLSYLTIFLEIYGIEKEKYGESDIFNSKNWDCMKRDYEYIKFLVRRIEYKFNIEDYEILIRLILHNKLKIDRVIIIIKHNVLYENQQFVLNTIRYHIEKMI